MRTIKKSENEEQTAVDVDTLETMAHQVAGYHMGVISKILNDNKGNLYKPYKPLSNPTFGEPAVPVEPEDDEITRDDKMVPVTKNELDFYLKVKEDKSDPTIQQMKTLMPQFKGTVQIKDVGHLILEDITHGFVKPCVLDLKLGRCRHYPSRPKEKLINDKTRYPGLLETGFCIPGMKLYHTEKDEVEIKLSPEVTHHFTSHDVEEHIRKFVRTELDPSKNLSRMISEELKKILKWVQEQKSFILRGSSVLIAYDGICFSPKGDEFESPTKKMKKEDGASPTHAPIELRVKMIDFAHVFHSRDCRDENYLFGMKNLVDLFDQIQSK